MTDISKSFLSTIRDLETRIKALESANQVERIVVAGNTILDALGLNSLGSFKSSQVFNGSAGLSTSNNSFVDVPGSSLDPFVTERTARILFWLLGFGYNDDNLASNGLHDMEVQLYDSVPAAGVANIYVPGNNSTHVYVTGTGPFITHYDMNTSHIMISRSAILDMDPGNHNLKLQYRAVNGGNAVLDGWLIGYFVFGS